MPKGLQHPCALFLHRNLVHAFADEKGLNTTGLGVLSVVDALNDAGHDFFGELFPGGQIDPREMVKAMAAK